MSHVMNKHRCECCLPGIHDSSIRVNTESIRASMLRVLFINYNAEHRISPTTFLHIHSGRFDSTTNEISQRNVVILYRLIKIKKKYTKRLLYVFWLCSIDEVSMAAAVTTNNHAFLSLHFPVYSLSMLLNEIVFALSRSYSTTFFNFFPFDKLTHRIWSFP